MLKTAVSGAKPKLNRADRRRREREARKIVTTKNRDVQDAGLVLKAAENLRQQDRLDEAIELCRKLAGDHPDLIEVHIALGTLHEQAGQAAEAYDRMKYAVGRAPKNPMAWRRFGKLLFLMREYEASVIALEKSIALEKPNEECVLFYGRALQAVERTEDALSVFTGAVRRFPKNALLHLELAMSHQELGQFDTAREILEKVVEIDPHMIEAHFRLATMGETLEDREVSLARLEGLAANEKFSVARRASARFAVARIHNKAKDYDEAFAAFKAANDMLDETVTFDPKSIENYVNVCRRAFTPEVFETMTDAGNPTHQPIFILGMPRSGTTLTEQIISSHPAVAGGGEERKLTQLSEALMEQRDGALRFPHDVGKIEPKLLAPIGEQYLQHMRRRFPGDERITDKNPFNFYHLGLIGLLFPNAGIIHCRRDPMDTCLSCYFQYFGEATALGFTTRLENLAFFYTCYQRIMEHWHEVLPGRILDVDYEEMVADQEGVSRRIIDHLQLPWDDACLNYSENDRGIRTASQWQVRQPIYKTSVKRWQAFEQHLGPLKEGLGIA